MKWGLALPPSSFPWLSAKGWTGFCRTCAPPAGHTRALQPCLPLPNPTRISLALQGPTPALPLSAPKSGTRLHYLSKVTPPGGTPDFSPWPPTTQSAAGLGCGSQLAPQACVEWKLIWLSCCLLHQGAAGRARGWGWHSSPHYLLCDLSQVTDGAEG